MSSSEPDGKEVPRSAPPAGWTYPPHPAADLFPVLEGRDFDDFVDGIDQDGQLEPIVIYRDDDGRIWLLDGRNRDRALRRLGREPQVVEWTGECGSPSAFVIAKNLHRRHLDPGQRAALAVELLPMLREEARERQRQAAIRTNAIRRERKAGRTLPAPLPGPHVRGEARAIAGDLFGASARSVSLAAALGARSPRLLEEVKAGRLTLAEARRVADREDPSGASERTRRPPRPYRDRASVVRSLEGVVGWLDARPVELNGTTDEALLTAQRLLELVRGDPTIEHRPPPALAELQPSP